MFWFFIRLIRLLQISHSTGQRSSSSEVAIFSWQICGYWRGRHSSGTELTQLCTNTVTAPGVLVHHLPSRVWALLPAQPGSASGYTGIVNMVVVVAISLVTSGYSAVSRYPHLGAVHIWRHLFIGSSWWFCHPVIIFGWPHCDFKLIMYFMNNTEPKTICFTTPFNSINQTQEGPVGKSESPSAPFIP